MRTFRFLHAADLHLDTPFTRLATTPPEVAARLRDASLEAFDALVDAALARDVAFVLLAGDLWDGPELGLRAGLALRRGVERLAAHGIEVFMVAGDRDAPDGWPAASSWPEGVHVFGAAPASRAVVRGGERLATVHGASPSAERLSAVRGLEVRDEARAAGGVQIGLLHCDVDPRPGAAPCAACTVEELRAAGMDYWALGHAHERRVIRDGEPWIVYPGCLQGRSPEPAEAGAKGAVVVEVDGAAVRAVEFVPLDRVRFVDVTVDIQATRDLPALHATLLAETEWVAREHAGRGIVLGAHLVGGGPLGARLGRAGGTDDLVRRLRDDMAGRDPFVWWDAVRVGHGGVPDLEAVKARGDLAAEVLAQAERLAGDPERLAAFVADATRPLRDGARRWLEEVDQPAADELLAAGLARALAMLEGEDA
ncbi:MAG: DNA repair exonuclease [Gemmatimonadetes bacterium]|nr:DNA repair exonuclease [Gemmatimonadota bacterium]